MRLRYHYFNVGREKVISAIKLDEIDAKILKTLLKDGRKKFTEIAKEAHVSKDIIWQHYNNMKKSGIIIGATIQLNYASLGYNLSASFFVDVIPKEQHQVIEQLRKIPGLYDAYRWGSHSRIWAVSDLMRVDQLEQIKQSINELPSVTGLEVDVWTGIRRTPENLSVLVNDKISSNTEKTEIKAENRIKKTAFKIDEIDKQIIEKLADNSQASFSAIGKELGIATSTVARRYHNLKHMGIIRAIIQIDPRKIGYPFQACFRLKTKPKSRLTNTAEKIAKLPDVVGILKTTSAHDLTIFTVIKNFEHLMALETEIANIQGVNEMDTAALNQFPVLPYPREHMPTL